MAAHSSPHRHRSSNVHRDCVAASSDAAEQSATSLAATSWPPYPNNHSQSPEPLDCPTTWASAHRPWYSGRSGTAAPVWRSSDNAAVAAAADDDDDVHAHGDVGDAVVVPVPARRTVATWSSADGMRPALHRFWDPRKACPC